MAKMVEGKVVVVTGAGRGIGAAIAKLMAKEGAKVVVNDIGVALDGAGGDQAPAAEVVAEIKQAGGAAVVQYGNTPRGDGGAERDDIAVAPHLGAYRFSGVDR